MASLEDKKTLEPTAKLVAGNRRVARRRASLLSIAGLLLVLASGCGEPENLKSAYRGRTRADLPLGPIIVVSIDTLRADRTSAYGYFRKTTPFLEELARKGVLFETTITTMATTLPAHTSLWTSLYPLESGVVANGKKYNSPPGVGVRFFAETLADQGYTTAAFVSATPLKWSTGIGRGFAEYSEPEGSQRPANETMDLALAWLEEHSEENFFLWLHFFDPHQPYQAAPPYDTFFNVDRQLVDYLRDHHYVRAADPEIQRLNNQYDNEVRLVDDQLRRLGDMLKDKGLFDASTMVVVSDHGEGLGQHDFVGHGKIHNEQLRVPFVLKLPAAAGFSGLREDRPVSLVDVVPTLVEELGMNVSDELQEQFSGVNALGDRVRRFAFAQRTVTKRFGPGKRYSLHGRRWKYLLDTSSDDELFDLEQDPFERRNVLDRERSAARKMRQQLVDLISQYSNSGQELGVEEEISEETLEELRALGYLN